MSSDEQSFFLIPASSGLCIEPQDGGLFTRSITGEKQQRWQLDYDFQNDKMIAFRNLHTGEYMCASNGIMGAPATTKKVVKQYFTLEACNTPGAFWIQSISFPSTYLCNSHGYCSENNQTCMWVREPHMTQTMLWYIVDYDIWKTQRQRLEKPDSAISLRSSQPHDSVIGATDGDLSSAEQVQDGQVDGLTGPEQLAKEKQLADKERLLAAKEQILAERENQLSEREKAVTELLEAKERDVAERERQVEVREARLSDVAAGKTPQGPAGEARGRALAGKGEAAGRALKDQGQTTERQRQPEGSQREIPETKAKPATVVSLQPESNDGEGPVESSAAQATGRRTSGLKPSIAPPNEGQIGAKQLEDAELDAPKPVAVGTQPEAPRTKDPLPSPPPKAAPQPSIEDTTSNDREPRLPPPRQIDPKQDGIGAPTLEEAKLPAPKPVPVDRDRPKSLKTDVPAPGVPESESGLRPIKMQRGFSFLDRL